MRSREAQRLYQAIDGRKSLAELATLTELNTKDIEKALHQLVTQNLVQVCNKTGQPIDGPWSLE
jgi:DNA-binding transcriptional regulator YhcF (GntR family)